MSVVHIRSKDLVKPDTRWFTRLTSNGHVRGFAVKIGRRWHGWMKVTW